LVAKESAGLVPVTADFFVRVGKLSCITADRGILTGRGYNTLL
jgi:hypothetical protein